MLKPGPTCVAIVHGSHTRHLGFDALALESSVASKARKATKLLWHNAVMQVIDDPGMFPVGTVEGAGPLILVRRRSAGIFSGQG